MSTLIASPPAARIWQRARGAVAWDAVVPTVDGAALDATLGADPGAFCARVTGHERDVSAARALTAPVPWVLMLEVDRLPVDVLEGLAAQHAVLLLAPGTTPAADRLVRVNPDHLEDLLPSGRVHAQDCLLAGPLAVGPLLSAPRG
jgi:hypothetical protein